MSFNKVILEGNLGKDPETRYTQGGDAVCNFSIATTERWTKDGEKKEKTEWHNIVIFGKLAEIAEKYLRKGFRVLLEGKLQTRKWEKDGVTRYTTEVVVSQVDLIDFPDDGERAEPVAKPAAKPKAAKPKGGDELDDDIPF